MSTLAAGLFFGAPGAYAAPAPPSPVPSAANPGQNTIPNPSNAQLTRADALKAVKDQEIGVLSGEIAAAQARLNELQRQEQLAEQRVALTYTEYRDAVAEKARAASAQAAAEKNERSQQVLFARYMQASYMDGRPSGLTGTLLSATDPTGLLNQTNYQQYESEYQAGVIGQMQLASVRTSNSKARAEVARAKAKKTKIAAEKAQRAAAVAVENQQNEQAGLESTMSQKQTELTTAKAQVVQLYNNRATNIRYQQELTAFNEYVRYTNAKQAYEAYQVRQQKIAAAKRAAAAARAKAEAARAKAEEARERARGGTSKKKKKKGGSNSSGGGSSFNDDPPKSSPPPPSSGGWTQAKGNRAVARAKRYLGDTYAWAGGNAKGPTYGVCVDGAAANDCYIKGFDCSGLVMYAWGKNWHHYADTQYGQAGSYHPSIRKLKPGDLMFFGYRGGGSDLHHVAMYVGNKKMIEAPQSNDVIQISSIYKYSDYYGATRPLS